MLYPRRVACTLAALALALPSGTDAAHSDEGKSKRPSLSLKVTPPLVVAPGKVRAVVELRGGSDDYEAFYCPTVEWDWGDETKSEMTQDCQPYVPGNSTIRRRFTADHVFQQSGDFKVTFRLKRQNKIVASSATNVVVRGGLYEPFMN